MAEAFSKIHGKHVIEAYSAGSRPLGTVNDKAIKSMRKVGYDLTTHKSKSLNDIPNVEYDFAITMGCGDECPYVRTKQRQNWGLPDPKNMNDSEFDQVRDLIEEKVLSFINILSIEE